MHLLVSHRVEKARVGCQSHYELPDKIGANPGPQKLSAGPSLSSLLVAADVSCSPYVIKAWETFKTLLLLVASGRS
jgi:hypothetical protein